MNASSIIQIDFGHRTVDITVEQVRSWRPWTEDTVTAACKALRLKSDHPGARESVKGIIDDVASQTRGCELTECMCCGADSYGSDVGSDVCPSCYELGGIDNHINDNGLTEIDADDMADIRSHLDEVERTGGSALKALSSCDYIRNVGVKS